MNPFLPATNGTVALSAGTTSTRVQLGAMPRTGSYQLRVENEGASAASYRVGDNTVVATTGDLALPAGGVEVITVPNTDMNPQTYVAAITASGTAALKFTTGQGF